MSTATPESTSESKTQAETSFVLFTGTHETEAQRFIRKHRALRDQLERDYPLYCVARNDLLEPWREQEELRRRLGL